MTTERGVARRTRGAFEVIFERHLPHSPARVWAMLTQPENIEAWFCARVEIDGRPGGKMVEHHEHVGVDVHGEVTRWEPPRVFEHTWWFGELHGAPMGTVSWEIFPEGSGTKLILTHRRPNLDAGGMTAAHTSLDVLCAVLDGADPKDHAAPEGEFRDGEFVETRPGRGRWADRARLQQEYERDFAAL